MGLSIIDYPNSQEILKSHLTVEAKNIVLPDVMPNICRGILKTIVFLALAGVAQWIESELLTKGLPVQFPVRAHAWIAGQDPSEGHVRGNHTLMFLSLPISLPFPLSKNK